MDNALTTYIYQRAGECDIRADVYREPGQEIRPVVLWVHGGALVGGNRTQIPGEQVQRYLDAGFVVVSIDYRLAPETKLDGIVEDLRGAYGWVRTQGPRLFHGDSDRIVVVGHSAGGYLTLMAGFCVTPRPRALVPFYGYGDIAAPWYSRPDPFYCRMDPVTKEQAYAAVGTEPLSEGRSNERFTFYLYCRQHGLWPQEVAGHDPDREPRAFDPFCPVRNVTSQYPPTMLLHGDQDTDVPVQQSIQMAEALKLRGVEHELVIVENGGHGFDGDNGGLADPQNAARFRRVLDFLEAHTQ